MRLLCSALLLPLAGLLLAEEEERVGYPSVSPDKQWEYRVSGENAVLVRAGSDATVLDFGEEVGHLAAKTGKVVWAPDSRRFAFNTRKGGKYYGCDLYELKGTTWEKLPQLEDHAKTVTQLIKRTAAQRRKQLRAKATSIAHPFNTVWRVRRWLTNDTFEAYASDFQRLQSSETEEDGVFLGAAVLFQAKCDGRGGWKVSTSRLLSDAEDEGISEEDA